MSENPHKNHRARLKARFLSSGLSGFEPHQVLEMLLFFAIPQGDTNPIAHRLIKTFGSLNKVLDADYNDLLQVQGIGEHAATLIKFMTPMFRYYNAHADLAALPFNSPENVGDYLLGCYSGYTEEVISLLSLDSNCRILSFDIIGKGDIASVTVSTRKLVETVLKTKASCVILCHNHPGGNALPSSEDLTATVRIAKTLHELNVALIDHFILCEGDYISLYQSENYKHLFKV